MFAKTRQQSTTARKAFARPAGQLGLAVCLLAVTSCGWDCSPPAPTKLFDLAGRPIDPLRNLQAPAIVFLFTRADCPVSNRFAPEVKRLYERFSPHGVIFWLVYPDSGESADSIKNHVSEYGYSFGALRDPQHALVSMTQARITPEAAVFVPAQSGPQMVYRGRIDDRFVDFGEMRPEPTVRDLEQLLQAIVDGKRPPPKITEAIGCFIADLR